MQKIKLKKRKPKKTYLDGMIDAYTVAAEIFEENYDGAKIWQTHHIVAHLRHYAKKLKQARDK